MYSDLQTISPEQYMKQITRRLTELHAVSVSNILTLDFDRESETMVPCIC